MKFTVYSLQSTAAARIYAERLLKFFRQLTTVNRQLRASRGFTLLLAALIASLLLLLGSATFGLARKEVLLSSLGRDSQFAFYAADTGAECAIYWDLRHQAFASTTGFALASCDGQDLGTLRFEGYDVPIVFEFEPNGYCAHVTVTKLDLPATIIVSRGYSSSCANIEFDPRTLERAVRVTY